MWQAISLGGIFIRHFHSKAMHVYTVNNFFASGTGPYHESLISLIGNRFSPGLGS
jgi:hypothetical protein